MIALLWTGFGFLLAFASGSPRRSVLRDLPARPFIILQLSDKGAVLYIGAKTVLPRRVTYFLWPLHQKHHVRDPQIMGVFVWQNTRKRSLIEHSADRWGRKTFHYV